jgi:hypothetical protein
MRRTGRSLDAFIAVTIAFTCVAAMAAVGSLIGGIAYPVTTEMATSGLASRLAPAAGFTGWTQSILGVTILARGYEERQEVEAEEEEEAESADEEEEEREGVFDRLWDCVMLA